jgi:hypothetical protein
MRVTVLENNIYRWAGSLIGELCEIRTSTVFRKPVHVMAARS